MNLLRITEDCRIVTGRMFSDCWDYQSRVYFFYFYFTTSRRTTCKDAAPVSFVKYVFINDPASHRYFEKLSSILKKEPGKNTQ